MDERMRFVIRLKDGESMASLCREFGLRRLPHAVKVAACTVMDRHGLVTHAIRSGTKAFRVVAPPGDLDRTHQTGSSAAERPS
jgi:hypothetical protein